MVVVVTYCSTRYVHNSVKSFPRERFVSGFFVFTTPLVLKLRPMNKWIPVGIELLWRRSVTPSVAGEHKYL